jgi:hypothetical protein
MEAARGLMAEARALREKQDFRGALERFRAADAIMGVPTTGYELAQAQADVGQLLEARATARRVLASPAQPGEPEPFSEARARAEALDATLDARLGALHFVVHGALPGEAVRITVDGEDVPVPALSLPFRVNPGHHQVVAQSGQRRVTREVEAREKKTVEVPLDLPKQPASIGVVAGLEPTTALRTSAPQVPTLTYVAGGLAVAGLAVGGVTGVLSISKTRQVERGCAASKCPPNTWSDLDDARSLATVSTVGFAFAGAAAATALLGWLLVDRAPSPALRTGVAVSKQCSSLTLSGQF